jgi:hypothetical protein
LLYQLSYVRTHQDVLVQSLQLLLGAKIRHAYATFCAANANQSFFQKRGISTSILSNCEPPLPARAQTMFTTFHHQSSKRLHVQVQFAAASANPTSRQVRYPIPLARDLDRSFGPPSSWFEKAGGPVVRLAWMDHFRWRGPVRGYPFSPVTRITLMTLCRQFEKIRTYAPI